jgi:predicted AAA+ superfamily ATPase
MEVARAIASYLAPSLAPVTILEGPRMSGKTFIARKLADLGVWERYETLANSLTLELAKNDLPGWLESLPDTAIIDEAQLLADLPLAIKDLVDRPSSSRHFLLTGSARLGRDALGGSDPLTGRVRRWQLAPLTLAEMQDDAAAMPSLISRLFDGSIVTDASIVDVPAVVNRGGFPILALNPASQTEADMWVRDTTLGLLMDSVLPDDHFDAGTALRVLDAVLRDSAGILNVTATGQRIGIDSRTVDRYLDVCERRFLLHFLPNYETSPIRQSRARSKVHPVDTAFAAASLRRANPEAAATPTVLGHLFESWVVNQVVPCLQFAGTGVHAYYWRRPKDDAEVDLLLVDDAGRRVGIEVKTSSQVSLKDARGLHSLDKVHPLVAGYVVHAGSKASRLADRCWALPAAALA